MSLDPTKHQNRISDCHVEAGTINLHPTPSITVGTQVRLTGVVVTDEPDIDGDYAVAVEGARKSYNKVWFNPTDFRNLEVIRQPFKRGEVVYNRDESEPEPFVVLNDESLGMVDVACCRTGFHIANDNPEAYERRP